MRTSLSEGYKCFNTHNSECIYPLLRLQLYKRLRILLVEGREIFHFSPKGLTEMLMFWGDLFLFKRQFICLKRMKRSKLGRGFNNN